MGNICSCWPLMWRLFYNFKLTFLGKNYLSDYIILCKCNLWYYFVSFDLTCYCHYFWNILGKMAPWNDIIVMFDKCITGQGICLFYVPDHVDHFKPRTNLNFCLGGGVLFFRFVTTRRIRRKPPSKYSARFCT